MVNFKTSHRLKWYCDVYICGLGIRIGLDGEVSRLNEVMSLSKNANV